MADELYDSVTVNTTACKRLFSLGCVLTPMAVFQGTEGDLTWVCRWPALCGETWLGPRELSNPCTQVGHPKLGGGAVVGGSGQEEGGHIGRQFVTYDSAQAYPDLLLTLRRD